MKRLKRLLLRMVLCRLSAQHDGLIVSAAIQGPALRYASLTPAKIIANMECRNCAERWTREYRTDVILQKSRQAP